MRRDARQGARRVSPSVMTTESRIPWQKSQRSDARTQCARDERLEGGKDESGPGKGSACDEGVW